MPKPGEAGGSAAASTATIQAHGQTNSLIISAPPAVFRSLASVVRQLDVRRAQVLIEAIIAEVADSTASEIGVQWFTAPQRDDGTLGQGVIGGTNFPGPNGNSALTALATNPLGLSGLGGLSLGYIDGTIAAGHGQGDPQPRRARACPAWRRQDQYPVDAIDPHPRQPGGRNQGGPGSAVPDRLLHQHRQQRAERPGHQSVPDHRTQGCRPGTQGHSARQRRRCRAHGDPSGSLLAGTAGGGAVDLVTNKRELTTSVLVADNALLVLGGLIDTNVSDSNSKVPGLGSIPVIGNLFRYRSEQERETRPDGVPAPQDPARRSHRAAVSSESTTTCAPNNCNCARKRTTDPAQRTAAAARSARFPQRSRHRRGRHADTEAAERAMSEAARAEARPSRPGFGFARAARRDPYRMARRFGRHRLSPGRASRGAG
ncbi:MAG: hypothetical protein IPQ17_07290 [Xanthomonadales bacterium]|nr:hypothetical protein [Xanthomonadales bacterium]